MPCSLIRGSQDEILADLQFCEAVASIVSWNSIAKLLCPLCRGHAGYLQVKLLRSASERRSGSCAAVV